MILPPPRPKRVRRKRVLEPGEKPPKRKRPYLQREKAETAARRAAIGCACTAHHGHTRDCALTPPPAPKRPPGRPRKDGLPPIQRRIPTPSPTG